MPPGMRKPGGGTVAHRNSETVFRRVQGGGTPAGALPTLTKEARDDHCYDSTSLTRVERLLLATAALRGVLAGAARAITAWLLDQYIY